MSIEKLEEIMSNAEKIGKTNFYCSEVDSIFVEIINTFKHQSDQIADLRQELAKKEDVITLSEIKEVRNLNEPE